jgi:hypothetical protein
MLQVVPVISYQLSVIRRQETGDRRQETGDRRQETGDGRRETGLFWFLCENEVYTDRISAK